MENVQEGLVIEKNGTFATIKVLAHSNCENCGTCAGREVLVQAYNPVNAKIGDKIKFISSQNNALKITFILFFLPMISIFTGSYIGNILSEKFHFHQIGTMVFFGALFFIFSVIYMVIYDRKSKANHKNIAKISEIIN
jgi:sigma-E factor negative regulatory protein RseC